MAAVRPKKQQRLVLAVVALAVLAIAGIIAMFALEDTAAYFRAPADIAANPPEPGETFRLGGLVKTGSIARSADGLGMTFVVMDMKAETPVSYRGLTPDLFREGQGVIATGTMDASGRFRFADGQLVLDDASARNRRYSLDARLKLGGQRRDGRMLVKWGPLAVGVDLQGNATKLRLRGASQWYETGAP